MHDPNDEYPIKDPNTPSEYKHLEDGGYEGHYPPTGHTWGRRKKEDGTWEDYGDK